MLSKININDTLFDLADSQSRNDIQVINEKISGKIKWYESWEWGAYAQQEDRSMICCTIVNGICHLKGRITCSSAATKAWNTYPVLNNLPIPANNLESLTYGFVIADSKTPFIVQ